MGRPKRTVEALLQAVLADWEAVSREALKSREGVVAAVGAEHASRLAPALDGAVRDLERSLAEFREAVEHPEVVIATTGTTSSGKSTIANMLIGDPLLPKAVQEMSAGVVTVRHAPTCLLEVVATKGATWPTGTWDDPSADDVRMRLRDTMAAYRDTLGLDAPVARPNIEAPRFEIRWPTRMGEQPARFGLPAGARLVLTDLPGLKFVDDEVNGPVIRQQVRRALCLVAYNSFEVDPRKQETLLRQVVDQVKALRGSPARMLFVLNRIDAYRTDHDPMASERSFTARVTRQIRGALRDALNEHSKVADSIEPIPLSSEPALYALIAQNQEGEAQVATLRRLAKEYAVLFPDEEMDRLPRSPAAWTDDQTRWFIQEAVHQSRLDSFEKRLAKHISENLPELLVPGLVSNCYDSTRRVLEALEALIGAYEKTERADLEEAKTHLESVHQGLREKQQEALRILDPLREVAGGDGDLVTELPVAVARVEADLGLRTTTDEAGPLAALNHALFDSVQGPVQRLNDFVIRSAAGEDVDDDFNRAAASPARLESAIAKLSASPFGPRRQNGGQFEGSEATKVEAALREFGQALAAHATAVVARESAAQADRMRAALEWCGSALVDQLESAAKESHADFKGLRGVFRGDFDLRAPRLPRVRFEPEVHRWKTQHTRQVGTKKVKTGTKRVWWTLWLRKRNTYKYVPVFETTTEEGIETPGLGELLDAFKNSAAVATLEEVFGAWLVDALQGFDAALTARLKRGVGTYRAALQERLEDLDRGALQRIQNVEAFRPGIEQTVDVADASRNWRDRHG